MITLVSTKSQTVRASLKSSDYYLSMTMCRAMPCCAIRVLISITLTALHMAHGKAQARLIVLKMLNELDVIVSLYNFSTILTIKRDEL